MGKDNRGNKPSKTIALVANTSWSIYNFRLGLIKKLQALNLRVLIVAPKDHFSDRLVAEGCDYVDVFIDNRGTNPFNDLRTFFQLRRIYKRYKIDFIFHYTVKLNIYGSMAAAWNKTPSIAVTTGLGHLFADETIATSIAEFLYKQALRFSRQIWFLNEEDRSVFLQRKIIPLEKTYLLPSEGVNTVSFQRRVALSDNDSFTFLFIGRFIWDKGIREFVEAGRILKERGYNVNMQLLGFLDVQNPKAVSTSQIKDWVNKGLVDYLGVAARVRPYIEQASCVVLPSYYREGVSRVLLESSSMEVPLITTDNVGCREVVQDGLNGFLCKTRDTNDLVSKMEKMMSLSLAERKEMGAAGRQLILEKFDERLIIQHYLSTLEKNLSIKVPQSQRYPVE